MVLGPKYCYQFPRRSEIFVHLNAAHANTFNNIFLQPCRYKSLGNVCPFFPVWEENHCFSLSRMDLPYSLFLLDVTLENRLSLFLRESKTRPEVWVGSVVYQRQWGKFPVIFSVKTYIPQCSHIVYRCILWRGWRKVSLKFYVILKTSAPVSLCWNKGGESALSPRGSGACRGDIFYCQKVWCTLRAESPRKIEGDSARRVGLMEMIHRIINSLKD